ncbi:PepSY domain-containing protein [Methylobacter tundripaludum]|uniref:PepSY domain-containing protein n=1 Tax=Methylobacter tundripaludum TaxID=173365 RepID=UPI0004DFC920|nr:PepSY domain-containing protein [Methylobacter tundripaludum]
MNKQHNKILTAMLAMVIITGTVANVAQATDTKNKDAKELQLFSQAKISLSEAIKAAEQKTGGKAMEADIDDESSTVQFEIETVKDGKIHKVMVDGKTGNVLKVSLDDESNEGIENEKK